MSNSAILLTLLVLLGFGYLLGKARSIKTANFQTNGRLNLHSRPKYYGFLTAIWTVLPALLVLILWNSVDNAIISNLTIGILPADVQNMPSDQKSLYINQIANIVESGVVGDDTDPNQILAANHVLKLQTLSGQLKTLVVLVIALSVMFVMVRIIEPKLQARNHVESVIRWVMIACASIAIFTTFGIVFSVLFEAIQFFQTVLPTDFLFGTHWSPQTAIREGQVGGSGSFGAVPLFVGTLLISCIALIVAVPLGLMTAIYLSEYAKKPVRSIIKPILEILAGIPTIVYGFFAALTVAPFIRDLGESIGLHPASESALAAGLVMGIMIIPFVSSLSDDVISAVPQAMRDGSYAMGATQAETITKVIIPAALPGIVGSILLAASRAIGETMIVVMAAGLSANLSFNPLDAVTTVTVQIVTLLTGDQEFDSPKTLVAFALGLSLFVVTLILNMISLYVVRKYREQYE